MTKAETVLKQAKRIASSCTTWADLSNALFDPVTGLVARAFPTREARSAFVKTSQYKQIRQLLTAAMERHGLVEGATPSKSGRFVVRLPKSLHAALEREASAEGVSLNQLVVAKLSHRLERLAGVGLK
jgi:predicted HicB family RNase H-like nuclease